MLVRVRDYHDVAGRKRVERRGDNRISMNASLTATHLV
jgi:hypothetical protein